MSINYKQSGVNYSQLDPIKKLAQQAAKKTAGHLKKSSFAEIAATRGESAFVWQQGDIYMAAVIEGLGTKNLVADEMRKITGKTYYDIVAHDTVASIINDLITVGATPLVLHAYWAVGDSQWLSDSTRMKDLVKGWKSACDLARITWGGGETPAYAGIIRNSTIDLAGSAVGIITRKENLITDKKLRAGDKILFLRSAGINANGLTLARALAKKLPKGYATPILPGGRSYGEALLKKTNIYAQLVQALFDAQIDIHYISNITGHGLRKIMRASRRFSYQIEKIFPPQPIFAFIQKHADLSDYEMYQTFNMGQDYAIFLPEKDVKKAQAIVDKNGFQSLVAGSVQTGERQVKIEPLELLYTAETLNLR